MKLKEYRIAKPKETSIYDVLSNMWFNVYADKDRKYHYYIMSKFPKKIEKVRDVLDSYNVPYFEENKFNRYFIYFNDNIVDLEEKLTQSSSKAALQKNIKKEIEAGKDPKQAAAIAYSVQRKNESIKPINENIDFVKNYLNTLKTENNTIRALKDNERLPRGFRFLSGTGKSGEVRYNGIDYAFAVLPSGKLNVWPSYDAGWNWSQTLYNEDYDMNTNKSFTKKLSTKIDEDINSEIYKGDEFDEIIKSILDNSTPRFLAQMLGRLEMDVKYFLGHGNKYEKHLWAKDVDKQIRLMKAIYNALTDKEKLLIDLDLNQIENMGKIMKDPNYKFNPNAINKWTTDRGYVSIEDVETNQKDLKEDVNNLLSSPEIGPEFGMATIINSLIKDEWEAVDAYNSAIVNAQTEGFYDIAKTLTDIQNEENVHIGQLQKCMEILTPSVKKIEDGEKEVENQVATLEVTPEATSEAQ